MRVAAVAPDAAFVFCAVSTELGFRGEALIAGDAVSVEVRV